MGVRVRVDAAGPIRMVDRAIRAVSLPNASYAVRDAARVYARGIERRAPKRSGRLARSFEIRPLGPLEYEVSSDLIYAPVQEYGAFIKPKTRKVLRFADGRFSMRARIPAQPYVAPTFTADSDAAFDAFADRVEREL